MTTSDNALLVVRLTDSFSDFWPLLAADLQAPLLEWRPADGEPPPPGVAVLLIAAGGAEPDLPAFIPTVSVPSDVPIIAVGAATAHRLAAQAVAAGAAHHLPLPHDRDAVRELAPAAGAPRRAGPARGGFPPLPGGGPALPGGGGGRPP